jgi:CO/xanthine dehydrogenase Mo-binding subunit
LLFVRSPVARGRILAVNSPPEVPIITAAVLGDVRPICPLLDRPDYVPVAQPILADDRVTYVGEPIAAVIADTAAEAEDFAEEVTVEIAAETPVVTLDQALAPGAPLVHDMAAQNTLIDARFETPDVAAAFAAAQQVVEFTFTSGRQAAVPLEARGAVAAFDSATGRVTLSASTQMPHLLRTGIADTLRIPESELRIIAPEVGGGFGQKMALIPEYVVAVWAARHFACTVAWIEDRLENLTASFHARDQRLHLRGAFDADGRLLAIDADILCNVGAYSNFPATCGVEPLMALADMPGPYRVRGYRARARAVASNTCPMAPYRGVSRPVITAAMERLMDCAAASDIEIGDGRAFVRGTDLGVEVRQLARAAYHQSHRFPAIAETGLSAVATYDPYGTFSNACHVAIVEVDIATGQVMIERFVVVEDAGRLINPMIVEGQIHGGVAQGIANALYEKVVYDDGGNILTGSLADYLVPTMAEIPELEIHHLETLTGASVTGAKGVGEGGTIGAPAAVLNAVSDALAPFGVGIFEMPITPQRILQLLREAGCEAQ